MENFFFLKKKRAHLPKHGIMAHIPWPLSQYNVSVWLYTETRNVGIN